ncbi:MAG: hypothetical protein QGG46_04960 [Gammaproteobacteria bacterium]|nr:hypothetical protein [Gammaproteobacteria bacterium]
MRLPGFLAVTAVLLSPLAALADGDDWRTWPTGERLKLAMGTYEPDLNTEIMVSEVGGPLVGTSIDFEDDLGLDDSKSASYASLDWRVFKKHSLSFNAYSFDRDATTVTEDGLVFDDLVVLPGVEVDTFLDVEVYELAYAYSLVMTESMNLSLGAGLSVQEFDIGIANTAVPADSSAENFTAPLPTFNLGYDYAFNDKWLLGLNAGYLDVDYEGGGDEFDAKILVGDIGLRWRVLHNFALGLHYSIFDLEGEYEDDDIIADIDLDYRGPRLSLDLSF